LADLSSLTPSGGGLRADPGQKDDPGERDPQREREGLTHPGLLQKKDDPGERDPQREREGLTHPGPLQKDWLGHRSIQHTTRYTQLSAAPFRDFWR
jgi:hypothetical protein